MAEIKFHKYVSQLPPELEKNSVYYVRNGNGFDIYVTNDLGLTIPYPLNIPEAEIDPELIESIFNKIGDLSQLDTSNKSNLVGAVNEVKGEVDTHKAEMAIHQASGTANAITINTGGDFQYQQGKWLQFKATANNTGNVTINVDGKGAKPFLKVDGSQIAAGGVKSPKVYKAYYDTGSGGRFFLLASAEGNAVAGDVLAGKTFSNDDDTGIIGTMPNRGSVGTQTITTQNGEYTIPEGYHNGIGKVRATFPNLIASNIRKDINVGGIIGTMIEGVRVLSGQKQTSGQATFYLANDSVVNCLKFELVLDFKPRYVYLRPTQGSPARRTIYSSFEDTYNFHVGVPNANVLVFRPPTSGNALSSHLIYKSNILPAKVDNTGIVLPIELGDGSNVNINWFVVE